MNFTHFVDPLKVLICLPTIASQYTGIYNIIYVHMIFISKVLVIHKHVKINDNRESWCLKGRTIRTVGLYIGAGVNRCSNLEATKLLTVVFTRFSEYFSRSNSAFNGRHSSEK